MKWVLAQTCKASKLAFYNIKRGRRLGLIPSAGIATADTWFKCFCTKTFPANTCWCWLTCLNSAFHSPIQFEEVSGNSKQKRTVTLIPSKTDTRISLRCQAAMHFIARHRRSTMTVWSRTVIRPMVSGHTSPPTGLQWFDPISWRQHSSFAWSSTCSSKFLWNVKQTDKFLKANKFCLKTRNWISVL